jgi:hypothetical protein
MPLALESFSHLTFVPHCILICLGVALRKPGRHQFLSKIPGEAACLIASLVLLESSLRRAAGHTDVIAVLASNIVRVVVSELPATQDDVIQSDDVDHKPFQLGDHDPLVLNDERTTVVQIVVNKGESANLADLQTNTQRRRDNAESCQASRKSTSAQVFMDFHCAEGTTR